MTPRLLDGLSVGRRQVANGLLQCSMCGVYKPTSEYTRQRGAWGQNCKPCEADRNAYTHMVARVGLIGVQGEIDLIRDAERVILDRKRRLRQYIEQGETP